MSAADAMSLFTNSTAIIIDDEVYKQRTRINKIKNEFEEKGISFVCCEMIPEKKLWDSYHNLSFIIVDWRFVPQIDYGREVGSGYYEAQENEVMAFVEYIYLKFFMPIFILSQEDKTPIIEKLKTRENLKKALDRKQIVVMRKNTLNATKIEGLIRRWCVNNPDVYTLKNIDNALQSARDELLCSLSKYDKRWPLIVYKTIQDDEPVEINDEYSEFLISNLIGRIPSIEYDTTIMGQKFRKMDHLDLIELYSNAKIVKYSDDDKSGFHTGDIYLSENLEEKKYIINITAGCDLRKKKMICLKGKPVAIPKEQFDPKVGLIQRNDMALIPSFFSHECVEFRYSDYLSKDFKNGYEIRLGSGRDTINYKRVGKLIHPYITFLQEGFSHYICRTGMMRHPNEAFMAK